jgi:hypothetical protein
LNAVITSLALIAEKRRRDAVRARISGALAGLFEHAPLDRAARVAASEVYLLVANALGVPGLSSRYMREVRRVCVDMGAGEINPGGWRWFVFLRRRTTVKPEVMPRRKLTYQELGKLRRMWYARARADGFDDIEAPDGKLRSGVSGRTRETGRASQQNEPIEGQSHAGGRAALDGRSWWLTRQELNSAYFQKRKDAYWRLREALDVWALYVVECLPIRDIEERTGMGRDKVHRTVKTFERWMTAGQPGLSRETSTDGEEALSDQ